MKKGLIVLALILILPTLYAVEFEMKDSFSHGETLLAKVSGNFLDNIERENIYFYRGHVKTTVDYDVAKILDEFYIYALLDKPEENYSIVIKDVRYMKGAEVLDDEIAKNFSVTNETADFSVNPGFISTNEDFYLNVQNLKDEKITISISTDSSRDEDSDEGFFASLFGGSSTIEQGESVSLKSGEIKKLEFNLDSFNGSKFNILRLSTDNLEYEVPIYAFKIEKPEEQKQKSFKIEPKEINVSLATESETKRIFYITNTGKDSLENITILLSESLAPYTNFSIDAFNEINPNSSVKMELTFNSPEEEEKISGKLVVRIENLTEESFITLNFIKGYIPLPEENMSEIIPEVSETCEEKEGNICKQNEKCNGETIKAKDDLCCLGTCEKIETSSTGKIVGWLIVIVIILFLAWFFRKKYRGAKREISLLDIGKGKN